MRQVGYLPELYEGALSEKYKILYLGSLNPATYARFSFQQAVLNLCIGNQKDKNLQLELSLSRLRSES